MNADKFKKTIAKDREIFIGVNRRLSAVAFWGKETI